MSTIRAHKFARKYGKRYGGNLCLEGSVSGKEIFDHEDLQGIEVPDNLVLLKGYVEYSPAKVKKTGAEGHNVQTSYVTGLAINDKQLYAITADAVYRIHGPWFSQVIKENPHLNSMWEDLKNRVVSKINKS